MTLGHCSPTGSLNVQIHGYIWPTYMVHVHVTEKQFETDSTDTLRIYVDMGPFVNYEGLAENAGF